MVVVVGGALRVAAADAAYKGRVLGNIGIIMIRGNKGGGGGEVAGVGVGVGISYGQLRPLGSEGETSIRK